MGVKLLENWGNVIHGWSLSTWNYHALRLSVLAILSTYISIDRKMHFVTSLVFYLFVIKIKRLPLHTN